MEDAEMVGEECVGFLFDGEQPKTKRVVEICGRSIHFLCIDDDPGHVQSGHYLWPGCVHLAAYLIQHRDAFLNGSSNGDGSEDNRIGDVLELGSGTGVLTVALSPFVQRIVASDHDPAALQLVRQNIDLNREQKESSEALHEAVTDVIPLAWGPEPDIATKFDLIVGSDLVYTETVVPLLFDTVHALLAGDGKFVLGASFDIGGAAEREIDQQCEKYHLSHERIELNPPEAVHPVVIHICKPSAS